MSKRETCIVIDFGKETNLCPGTERDIQCKLLCWSVLSQDEIGGQRMDNVQIEWKLIS